MNFVDELPYGIPPFYPIGENDCSFLFWWPRQRLAAGSSFYRGFPRFSC